MSVTEMTYLIRFNPDEARRRILAALREAKCHRGRAAELLSITQGSLIKYVNMLALKDAIRQLDAQSYAEGWRDASAGLGGARPNAGRPRLKEKKATSPRKTRRAARTG